MSSCVFTIVAKNYIGLAQILEKSFLLYNQDVDFKIFVADELFDVSENSLPNNVYEAKKILKNVPEEQWYEMAFKYNLTEFCTSIKPFIFSYLFEERKYDKVIYLDPDILVFSTFSDILQKLDKYSILLTPHVSLLHKVYNGELSENSFLTTGVYNLGFLALKGEPEVYSFLDWWSLRLTNYCFNEQLDSYFTDQKWIDFLPCFFTSEKLLIYRDLGCNVAPWNFFERAIKVYDNGNAYVIQRNSSIENEVPLVFVHYSGYNYREILKGNIVQNNIKDDINYVDIDYLFSKYKEFLLENRELFEHYIGLDYTYNYFSNGTPLISFYRRIFRACLNKDRTLGNPFDIRGETSFYRQLGKHNLLDKSSVMVDKISRYNVPNISRKLFVVNIIMLILKKVLGMNRFLLLIRLFRAYSRYETYIFMYDWKYKKSNLFVDR